MCGFGGGSDLNIAAAFKACTRKKALTGQAEVQALFIELIRGFLRSRKHSPGFLHIFVYIGLFRHIADQAKLTFAHKSYSQEAILSVLFLFFVHILIRIINKLFESQ